MPTHSMADVTRPHGRPSHALRWMTTLWLLLLALPASARDAWRESRVLAFGEGRDWMLVHVPGLQSERVVFPVGFEPTSLTVTRDGRTIVFTSRDAHHLFDALFAWDWKSKTAPRSIGMDKGRHGEPALSPDGQWVYFAHHPESDGPPGQHTSKATAQLTRVRIDGLNYERLTNAPGCHFAPAPATSGKVIFLHTPCDFTRSIKVLDTRSRQVTALRTTGLRMEQLSLSPDSKRGVYAEMRSDTLALMEVDVSTGEVKQLHQFDRTGPLARPQYGRSTNEILYQHDGAVWRFDGNTATRLFPFISQENQP
ncbi:hypothetical protein DAT35_51425 [Vitiosangium sp. GDMCC 1.1324]|nr:hypothetical protein DAT35_51425 [Vitiosangium sp. GDMCC 1.1324]